MKPIVRLKLIYGGIVLINLIQFGLMERYSSSRANITPVKLFQMNRRNFSTAANRKSENLIPGSFAKISRVIPLKHLPNFEQSSKNNNGSNRVEESRSSKFLPTGKVSSVEGNHTSTQFDKIRMFLSEDSWNHLKSFLVSDQELYDAINDLSEDIIENATNLATEDSAASQKLLISSITNELEKLKPTRMLEVDDPKKMANPGVRFNTKGRPILNVMPLQRAILHNPSKTYTTEKEISPKGENDYIASTNSPMQSWDENDIHNSQALNSDFVDYLRENRIIPGGTGISSTTPSLTEVLVEPDVWNPFDSTTFSPPVHIDTEGGFMPMNPSTEKPVSNEIPPSGDESFTANLRKPRGPSGKEEEYQIPFITTTSTSQPEVTPGYYTITQSTTPGPKVIWYNHEQTPEDTFYPNSDNFLMPPEEASIEIITDFRDLDGPIQNDSPPTMHNSFSLHDYSGSSLKSELSDAKVVTLRKTRTKSLSRENGGRQRNRSRNKGKGKRVKNIPLQIAETIVEHDGISYHYDDRHHNLKNNGGGSGKGKHGHRHHETMRNYGAGSLDNDLNIDIKHHEIVEEYEPEINEQPYNYNSVDDDPPVKYLPLKDEFDNHYHDSYPLPTPPPRKKEISPYPRYRPVRVSSNPYYRGQNSKPIYEKINNYNHDGYQEDHGNGISDYYNKKPSEDIDEKPGGWSGRHPGPAGNYHGSHGWKDETFFSKAKDYLKHSEFVGAQKLFEVSIGVLAFLAFGGYITMLLYQVFVVSSRRPVATILGKSLEGAGEIFDSFFSKGPLGQEYMDELEFIVKQAMANVKRSWMTKRFTETEAPVKIKGDEGTK